MRNIREMQAGWVKANGTKFGFVEYIDKKGEKRMSLTKRNPRR